MMLSGETIRRREIIQPHRQRYNYDGVSGGESLCGYDIRTLKRVVLWPIVTRLSVSIERFSMPKDVAGRVTDKSTWARLGVQVQNTIIEPGWCGWLTLELTYSPVSIWRPRLVISAGTPIAQVIFEPIDRVTSGYDGKYQFQPCLPVHAIFDQE